MPLLFPLLTTLNICSWLSPPLPSPQVWCHEGARQDWLRLPARAVATLLGHEATAVHHENTALVALGAWLEAAPGAAGLGAGQRAELLNLVRCSWIKCTQGSKALVAACL
jgi:hypothetical protein